MFAWLSSTFCHLKFWSPKALKTTKNLKFSCTTLPKFDSAFYRGLLINLSFLIQILGKMNNAEIASINNASIGSRDHNSAKESSHLITVNRKEVNRSRE